MNDKVGWAGCVRKENLRPLVLLSLAVWLHAAMATAIATMMPAIVDDIGGVALVPWTFALYEVGSIVVGAGSGLLVYRYHLRRPMALAAVMFAAGCVVDASAPSMPVLLAGRLLQGLGGGGLTAMTFIGLGRLFPLAFLPRAMAVVSAVWGSSAFLGPLIGGQLTAFTSWRAAFAVFSGMAGFLALWIFRTAPAETVLDPAPPPARFPVGRIALMSAGVLLIATGGVVISPWATPLCMAGGLTLLALFLVQDRKRDTDRLFPRNVLGFRDRAAAGMTMVLTFTIATIGITVYGPLFMVYLHDASILGAGYIIACSSVGWSLAAVAIAGSGESQDRRLIGVGMWVLAASVLGFFLFVASGPLWLIALIALAEGAGFGMAWAGILRRMLAISPDGDRERLSAAIPTLQRLGYALGAAWLGIVANARGLKVDSAAIDIALVSRWVFAACVPFAICGLFAATRFLRNDQVPS